MPSRLLLLLSIVSEMTLPLPGVNCLPSVAPTSILTSAGAPVPIAALEVFCAPLCRVCPCASCLTSKAWLPLTALSVVVALSTSLLLEVAEVARPLPAMFLDTVWNFASADCNWPRPENLAWSRARLALSLTTPVFCDCIWRSTFAYTSAEILPCVVCCVLLV